MFRYLIVLLLGALLPLTNVAAQTNESSPAPIVIIGTGQVGSALGLSWGKLGHPIIYGSRNPDSDKTRDLVSRSGTARAMLADDALREADIVVLALPFDAALELLGRVARLEGKIVIDPINALQFDNEQRLVDKSANLVAEEFQALMPASRVVKALNAINASMMMPEREFEGPISVPIAGDDAEAKRIVAGLIEELGLTATDVGPLFNARFVEAMAPLYVYMNAFRRPRERFEYTFSTK